jgi:hypothetical protein
MVTRTRNNGYANAPQYYVCVHCLSCSCVTYVVIMLDVVQCVSLRQWTVPKLIDILIVSADDCTSVFIFVMKVSKVVPLLTV